MGTQKKKQMTISELYSIRDTLETLMRLSQVNLNSTLISEYIYSKILIERELRLQMINPITSQLYPKYQSGIKNRENK